MKQLQGWKVAGKSWTALIGSLLTFIIPTVVSLSTSWPEPWPAVIGAVVAVLTAVGVYHAPYRPVIPEGAVPTYRRNAWPTI